MAALERFCFNFRNWLAGLPLAFALFLVYDLAVRHEEVRLAERYGEAFRRYRETAPRWLPRRLRPAFAGGGDPWDLCWPATAQAYTLLVLAPFLVKELAFG